MNEKQEEEVYSKYAVKNRRRATSVFSYPDYMCRWTTVSHTSLAQTNFLCNSQHPLTMLCKHTSFVSARLCGQISGRCIQDIWMYILGSSRSHTGNLPAASASHSSAAPFTRPMPTYPSTVSTTLYLNIAQTMVCFACSPCCGGQHAGSDYTHVMCINNYINTISCHAMQLSL